MNLSRFVPRIEWTSSCLGFTAGRLVAMLCVAFVVLCVGFSVPALAAQGGPAGGIELPASPASGPAGGAAAAAASSTPWCDPDAGTGPLGLQQPPPRPYWSELDGVPDYINVMNNFNIDSTLTLLVSIVEKAISGLKDQGGLGGVPDVDGTCVCKCGCPGGGNGTVDCWLGFLGTTVTDNFKEAVEDTKDD